mmetsp:Transcript_31921/g.93814  ORF Transcript_31921/g.93814 Transcript_31921/m.93814 type:complete len:303 (+) Transcript_31921:243-1151(+)
MRLTGHLNVQIEMLLDQIPQLAGPHLPPTPTRRSHERTVPGRVADVGLGMVQHQGRQVVLEGVADQYPVPEHLPDLETARVQLHGGIVLGLDVGRPDAGDVGTEIGDAIGHLNERIEENGVIPIRHGHTGQSALLPSGSDAHHFAIQSDVLLLLFLGHRWSGFDLLLSLLFLLVGLEHIVDAGEGAFGLLLLLLLLLGWVLRCRGFAFVIAIGIILIFGGGIFVVRVNLLAIGINKTNGRFIFAFGTCLPSGILAELSRLLPAQSLRYLHRRNLGCAGVFFLVLLVALALGTRCTCGRCRWW